MTDQWVNWRRHQGGYYRDFTVEPDDHEAANSGSVEWIVERSPGQAAESLTYISPSERAHFQQSTTQQDRRTGDFTNRLFFPYIGGDRYRVRAVRRSRTMPTRTGPGERRTQEIDLGEFTTWRKLYLDVYGTTQEALDFYNGVQTRVLRQFEAGFVKIIVRHKGLTDRTDDCPTLHSDLRFLNGSQQALLDLKYRGRRRSGGSRLSKRPWHFLLIVAPDMSFVRERRFRRANPPRTGHANLPAGDPLFASDRLNWASLNWSGGHVDISSCITFPNDTRIQWDLTPVIPQVQQGRGMTVASDPMSQHRALQDTNIDARYNTVAGATGVSFGNLTVATMGSGTEAQFMATVVHEIGHSIGQTVHEMARWDAAGEPMTDWENSLWHDDEIAGVGNHCSHNATVSPGAGTGQGSVTPSPSTAALCVMYYARHANKREQFCGICRGTVRHVDLNRSDIVARWARVG